MTHKKARILKRILIMLSILILVSGIGFFWYVSDYYRADEVAQSIYEEGQENGTIIVDGNLTTLIPDESNSVGIIFYPGAKVEDYAYVPLLNQLREEGFTVVLIDMPFHMAIFNVNAADDVFDLIRAAESDDDTDNMELSSDVAAMVDVEKWYIMGHSMGGAMASSYASDNEEAVEGLILIGAYVYGDYNPENALTIYGTFNSNLEDNIDYTENIVIIEGGNHAQYGNYGKQDGDPDATITDVEQQAITVAAILEFIFGE